MSPVVRTIKLAFNGLVSALVACVAWWAIVAYLLMVYGPAEAAMFAFASIAFAVLICSMIYHDRG